jgi:hypothetical protein
MATTAEWGAFEWGEAEWGDATEGIDWQANGSLVLNGSASLTLTVELLAAGALLLSGAAGLTTVITMLANGNLVLLGAANLRVARFAGILEECGDPLSTACQEGWMPGA